MLTRRSRLRRLVLAVVATAVMAAPAQAAFLGLDGGDVIDSVQFSIAAGGAVFTDSSDQLTISATATQIDLQGGANRSEILGGDVNIRLDVSSESLSWAGSTFYSYSASFVTRAGADNDVEIFSPTGGPAPEQDGRLLVAGDIIGTPTLTVFFDSTFGFAPAFTMTGTHTADIGDAQFLQAWGGLGSLADIFAGSSNSIPDLSVLLADGHLFSVRDVTLGGGAGDCGGGGSCVGTVLDQTGDWTAGGGGSISPQTPAGFSVIPEPGTFFLLGSGLVALAIDRRARARRRP